MISVTYFGHATEFLIYRGTDATVSLMEVRQAAKYCTGSGGVRRGASQRVIPSLTC